jgi:diguanylate cyclase (GGDEF)-like protein
VDSARPNPHLTLALRDSDAASNVKASGFAVPLNLPGGTAVVHLPAPPLLPNVDPSLVGGASVDPTGRILHAWGLARQVPLLREEGASIACGPLGTLLQAALVGEYGSIYHEGYRYSGGGGEDGPFILVINAHEERQARKQADLSGRIANTLRRFGKALTMNPTVSPLCVAAAHEIASSTELAAILLWVGLPETRVLKLMASVGVTRQGTHALAELSLDRPGSSAAELVAASRQAFSLANVVENHLTQYLEARFCYLRPGGVAILPLVISDRLLGVLELVGREGDPNFEENRELFQTLAEHLALALNSAQMFENFERLASHDPLTGIANHRAMQEFLHLRLTETQRSGQSLGAIMLDVDHFRAFNEEEGHDVGDEVLRRVADAIKECLRPYDLAARYGGEEFTVIVPGTESEGLAAVAERIRRRVEAIDFAARNGRRRHVTVSVGCAVYPDNAPDAPSLLRAADTAMYRAKRGGRNRVAVFDGAYAGEERAPVVALASLNEWIPAERRAEAAERVRRFAPLVDRVAFALDITASQRSILDAMAYVYDTVKQDRTGLESAEPFRILLPNLDVVAENFDGTGPQGLAGDRIPLLARLFKALLARETGHLDEASSIYDPEIVALTRTERIAA